MLVFSTSQFSQLTGRHQGEEGELADLGAGDGTTTKTMSAFFTKVTVTELSKPMRSLLERAGFRLVDIFILSKSLYSISISFILIQRTLFLIVNHVQMIVIRHKNFFISSLRSRRKVFFRSGKLFF
ncbi:hypothetical protein O3M35_011448 [Rhynocoris fuscipes]|uniref:Uncharacterized protein n=1 Tax=Rhynocoris fuscipes TaxID=488301 RepID=A0AAW1CV69_9HEMI